MVESRLQRTLGLGDGVVLAIGSIAGSGILFLPSLTYSLAGHEVLIVWGVGTLLCLPMLFVFTDMVRVVPDGSGIEGFVGRGLGPRVAATVPVLFLSVVVLGIPAGALVAGTYLRDAVGGGMWVQLERISRWLIGQWITTVGKPAQCGPATDRIERLSYGFHQSLLRAGLEAA